MNNETLMRFLPLVALIVVMYFLLIRPQRKKEKELTAMRASLKAGDSIITIGGIYGKVVKIKDDSVVIQIGADKVKMEITRWAVSQVVAKKAGKIDGVSVNTGSAKPKRLKKASDDGILDAQIEEVAENSESK